MYFEQMSFLMSSMSHADHVEENEIEAEEEAEVVEGPLFALPSRAQTESIWSMPRKRKGTVPKDNLAVVLKSLKKKQENEETIEDDPDRLFLLSLLQDLKMVPSSRKANVKIAMINAITNGLYTKHPPRPPSTPPFSY